MSLKPGKNDTVLQATADGAFKDFHKWLCEYFNARLQHFTDFGSPVKASPT